MKNFAINLRSRANSFRLGTRFVIATTIVILIAVGIFVAGLAQEADRTKQDVATHDYAEGMGPGVSTEKVSEKPPVTETRSEPSANLINATTYAFTSSAGNALEDMSSGSTLLIVADGDDTNSTVAPIGFDYWFDGIRQNNFSVNANGIMRLSATPISGSNFTNSLAGNALPSIMPYWDDLWIGNNGKVHYKVVGSAPTRKLVVEWQNEQIPRVAAATAGAGTFQAWLFESSGKIEFVYGTGMAANATNSGYSVGFGTSAAQFASVTTSGPTAAYGVANDAQTGAITSGTKYTFTPAVPADPTALTFTAVGLNTMTLNWTDNATNELGYVIYRSFDGVSYEFIRQIAAGSTSSIEAGLASNTTYFWRVFAVTEGSLSNALAASQATTTGTLSGTATVGPTGTYLSIGAAVTAINTSGLAGNYILELQTTYLSTVETFPLAINSVGSPSNTITLRPITGATALTIAGGAGAQTLNLNGAAYWTIDGRAGGAGVSQLTVSNTLTTGVPIQLINDARNNTLQYLTVNGVNTSATGGDIVFSTTTGVIGNNNNTIDNCDIKDGATTPANGIFSLGTAGLPNSNNTISNNLIHDNFVATTTPNNGILLSSAAGNLSSVRWTISNNKFYQSVTRTFVTTGAIHAAIRIGQDTGSVVTGYGHTVTGNTIGYASSTATGTYTMAGTIATRFIGINVNAGAEPTSIQNNTVTAFSLATSSGATTTNGVFSGINILQGNANIGTTTGNTIGGTGTGHITTTPTTTPALNVGISVHTNTTGVAAVNISNNTIGGFTANGSGSISGIAMSVGQPTITNNTIGNNTTALSMNSPTVAVVSTLLNGINVSLGTAPTVITGNIVANFSGAGTGTAAVGRGITSASSGPTTISGNTIHDIASASTNTTLAGGGTAVQGILQTGTAALGASVTLNTIYTLSATNTGAVQTNVTGIGYSNPTAGTITKNKIYDLRNASTMAVATTPPTASGIMVRTGTTSFSVINNMISLGTAQTTNTEFIGIWNSFAGTTFIAHYNSVHIAGTAGAGALPSYGFLRGDNTAASAVITTVDVKNNIFNNTRTGGTGKHYAIGNVNSVPATGWSGTASNNNVLNSPVAGTVGIWGLTLDRTFAEWKTSSGGDGASLSGVSVVFVDATNGDLHLNFGVTPTPLESGGVAVATTVDYDNQVRPGPAGSVNGGALAPDIGADEFDGVPQDITAPAITYTPFTNTTFTTNRTLAATIVDAGGVATGGLSPRIYYRKNGGAYFSNACTLFSGTVNSGVWNCVVDYSILVPPGATTGDVIDYFVVAQDVSGNLASNPSAGFAGTNVNTVTTPPTTPNTYTIVAAFPASVTVGSGGTYPSLTNAGGLFQAMNAAVFSGNVTVDIISDLLIESGTFALNALTEEGAGGYTVLIKPSGAARTITTTGTPTNLLKFNGVSRLTIDGSLAGGTDRSLTIENASTTATSVIVLGSVGTTPITSDTLKNCIVRNGVTTTSAVLVSDSATVGAAGYFNNITIQNNDIQRAFAGIFTNAVVAASNGGGLLITQNKLDTIGANAIRNGGINVIGADGTTTTVTVSQNTIGNFNLVDSETDFGINIGPGAQRVTVSGNTVSNLGYSGTSAFAPIGINIGTAVASAAINVTSNSVTGMNTNGSSPPRGIFVGSTAGGVTIEKNNVQGVINANTSTFGSYGVDVTGGNNNVVRNNFISNVSGDMTGGAAFSTTFGIFGLRIGSGTGHQIYNNSVNLYGLRTGTAATSLLTAAFGIVGTGSTGMDVRNNIFANNITGGTTSIANVSVYLPSGGGAGMTLTWNNNAYFYGTDAARQGPGQAGTTAGTNFFTTFDPTMTTPATNLRSYTSTLGSATNDNASQAATTAPPFVSNNDLHLSPVPNSLLSAGATIGSVTNDFDMDPRPASAPDIGADEIVQSVAGVYPAGTFYNGMLAGLDALAGNVTITNSLTLTGISSTGGNTLTIECNATVTGASDTSYVDGNVQKNFCGLGSFSFPVGDPAANSAAPTNGYMPVNVTVTALAVNPSSLTVNANNGLAPSTPALNAATTLSAFWTLTETGDITATLAFNYDEGDVLGNEANYRVIQVEGTTPINYPSTVLDTTNNIATVAGIQDFSDWTVGEPFAPTNTQANISGHVVNSTGGPLAGATMTLLDTVLGQNSFTTTNANGDYIFNAILTGREIVVTPSKNGYTFNPQSRAFGHVGDVANIDFVGTAGSTVNSVGSDFDGDGKADLSVFRPSDGTWYTVLSSTGVFKSQQWGVGTDRIVPADYDGDHVTDVAVFRPSNGTWYISQSSTSTLRAVNWGLADDIATPADFDGDGQADIAVWRPSNGTWYVIDSTTGLTRSIQWGTTGDRPVAADYDGDGKANFAVWRPSNGTWYVLKLDGNYTYEHWGIEEDRAVVGDYDGDHKADLAVFRPSTATWYVKLSSDNSTNARGHGTAADVLAPADYDGDGKTDRAVWQLGGDWNILRSTTNTAYGQKWGTTGDIPTTSAYVR